MILNKNKSKPALVKSRQQPRLQVKTQLKAGTGYYSDLFRQLCRSNPELCESN